MAPSPARARGWDSSSGRRAGNSCRRIPRRARPNAPSRRPTGGGTARPIRPCPGRGPSWAACAPCSRQARRAPRVGAPPVPRSTPCVRRPGRRENARAVLEFFREAPRRHPARPPRGRSPRADPSRRGGHHHRGGDGDALGVGGRAGTRWGRARSSWAEHAGDEHLRPGELHAQHAHERNRAALAHVGGGPAELAIEAASSAADSQGAAGGAFQPVAAESPSKATRAW